MTDSALYKYGQEDHIFVCIANASVYKTKIFDRRIVKRVVNNNTHIKIEYQVRNTAQDSPSYCWVDEDKCFSVLDINKIMDLDRDL